MPATQISTSPDISVLDSRIVADLCTGLLTVDASVSVFIGSGASSVLGVKVRITNPYDVVIKDYGTSYDFVNPSTGDYSIAIPKQAGVFQYGNYKVEVELTDRNSNKFYVTKTVNVCTFNEATNPCDERVRIKADCKNGRVSFLISDPPYFKGFPSESKSQTWTVYFPTASGASPIAVTAGNFSVQLFQGVYRLTGSVCATYNLTDNIYTRLGYSGTFEKNVKCLLDYSCIWPRIKQLNDNIKEDCSQKQRDQFASIILDALRLLKTAELANDAGEDASVYIEDLEKLLGCVCTCDCSGLPITNNEPSPNITIQGCNIQKETVGLTDIYTIDNYTYVIEVDSSQNVITVSSPTLLSCSSNQKIFYSAVAAYALLKTLISNTTEYNYWAAIIRLALSGLDLSCLAGPTTTFAQLIQSIINKACSGGTCLAEISNVVVGPNTTPDEPTLNGVMFSWDNNSSVFAVQLWIDDVLRATILSPAHEYIAAGVADNEEHSWALIPLCINGSAGVIGVINSGKVTEFSCPDIAPLDLSAVSVSGADCPFSLTSLINSLPIGITAEWHTANNVNSNSLVADPTHVSSGIYYGFAKNADNCYSMATQVTLVCEGAISCTAPQTLAVVRATHGLGAGHNLISFNGAAYPPPANSYTVKRRIAADPDIPGSYTTLSTPSYSSTLNRWYVIDTTAVNNTLYVYRAQSNCGDSPATTPYVDYTFANIICPTIDLTSGFTDVSYSFSPGGGGIDKYEIRLYDATGLNQLAIVTHTPAFSDPTTGEFFYLVQDTDYFVEATVYIGTYSKTCSKVPVTTSAP